MSCPASEDLLEQPRTRIGIESEEVTQVDVAHGPAVADGAAQGAIVEDGRHAVLRQAHVELEDVGPHLERQVVRLEGVLARIGRGSAVRDDEGAAGFGEHAGNFAARGGPGVTPQ